MLLLKDKLYFPGDAGGKITSPGVYSISDGKNLPYSSDLSLRARELYIYNRKVCDHDKRVSGMGQYLYNQPGFFGADFAGFAHQKDEYLYVQKRNGVALGKTMDGKQENWVYTFSKKEKNDYQALVLTKNVGLVLCSQFDKGTGCLIALNRDSGKEIWRHELPAMPVRWGIAVSNDGTIIVSMVDGTIMGIK